MNGPISFRIIKKFHQRQELKKQEANQNVVEKKQTKDKTSRPLLCCVPPPSSR